MPEHNRLVAIIFMLVSCVSSIAGFETINFQHLSLNSMFPQITINGLYQDESGILWIGTKDGVKKYNGNYIESVNFMGINNWIQSNLVPTICGDKKGHLYVNTDYSIIEYDLIKVIGMSLLLGIALPKALSGLTGGASVFLGNNIMVGVFSAIILNALFVALPDLVAKHRAPASVDVPAADPADGTGAAAYDER